MNNLKIQKILLKLIIFALTFGVLCTPFCALAVDFDFIENPSVWKGSKYDIDVAEIESLDGFYQYYFDEAEGAVYFHIMYCFEELEAASDVEIGVQIDNPVHSYDFTFCGDTPADYVNEFNIYPLFTKIEADGQEIFFAVEFLDKNDKKLSNDITVNLLINRRVYPVCKSVKASFQHDEEAASTVRPSKEATTSSAKAARTTTQKAEKSAKQKESAVTKFKASAEKGTKFKYDGNNRADESVEPTFGVGEVACEENSYKSELSLNSKICIIIAAALLASGTALIIHSAVKAKSKADKNS